VQRLDLAISEKKIKGLCLLCFENERPPHGVLGYFDWLFAGHFTKLLKTQVLTGKKGQILYTPVTWNGSTLHFLLVGGGYLDAKGARPPFDKNLLEEALKQSEGLQLAGMGLVTSDWNLSGKELEGLHLEKRNLCVFN
jgi:hypothetical protein